MAELVWDKVGERTYQVGIDRGVLYFPEGAVVWNGLTSLDEKFTQERKSLYLDGVRFLEYTIPGDYSAQIKAFTYPKEVEQATGVVSTPSGLSLHDQKLTSFGLSYRTLLGDDMSGTGRGYKIHLLYNLTAIPDSNTHTSIGDNVAPGEFSWSIFGSPESVSGYRPTAHATLDSTRMTAAKLDELEGILYGSPTVDPRLPPLQELIDLV